MSCRPWPLLILAPILLQAQNPFAGNASEADAGRGLFRIMCRPCHGISAQGGRGPDLTLGVYNNGNSDNDLFRVIYHGVQGTEMPSYGARIGDENVWRMVTYIRSLTTRKEPPPPGDRAAGEAFFWSKGGCGNCHIVGQRGSAFGPELTRIGRKRSLEHLRQSLTDPNADLTPTYYKITVTPRTGPNITGTQRNIDNFTAELMTTDGRIHFFERDAVSSIQRDYVSLMPAYKSLPTQDMNNILLYLLSLRGEN
ncbi:MAG: c-type cytochrome [Acidobacteria bacterium]|nr:c-type cytochrome [Acidobacteriota bacterium]